MSPPPERERSGSGVEAPYKAPMCFVLGFGFSWLERRERGVRGERDEECE